MKTTTVIANDTSSAMDDIISKLGMTLSFFLQNIKMVKFI